MKKKIFLIVLAVLLLLAIVSGIAIIHFRPAMQDLACIEAEQEILQKILDGQLMIDTSLLSELPVQKNTFPEFDSGQGTGDFLLGFGALTVPSIELVIPVVEGVDELCLRATAGHLPESDGIGEPGRCIIAADCSPIEGRHFNRLAEVRPGDEVRLMTPMGYESVYTVTKTVTVPPEELAQYLSESEIPSLSLVTSTDRGRQRILVQAELTQ